MKTLSGVAEERLTGRNALLNPYKAELAQADPVSASRGSSPGSAGSKGCFAATGRHTSLPFRAPRVGRGSLELVLQVVRPVSTH